MRLSIDDHVYLAPAASAPPAAPAMPADPTAPDVTFLIRETAAALQSFYTTIERITADNPVPLARLQELAGKARLGLRPRVRANHHDAQRDAGQEQGDKVAQHRRAERREEGARHDPDPDDQHGAGRDDPQRQCAPQLGNATAQIPAIAVTAYARREDRDRALLAGYDSHCPKPLDTAEFARVIGDLLRAQQSSVS